MDGDAGRETAAEARALRSRLTACPVAIKPRGAQPRDRSGWRAGPATNTRTARPR